MGSRALTCIQRYAVFPNRWDDDAVVEGDVEQLARSDELLRKRRDAVLVCQLVLPLEAAALAADILSVIEPLAGLCHSAPHRQLSCVAWDVDASLSPRFLGLLRALGVTRIGLLLRRYTHQSSTLPQHLASLSRPGAAFVRRRSDHGNRILSLPPLPPSPPMCVPALQVGAMRECFCVIAFWHRNGSSRASKGLPSEGGRSAGDAGAVCHPHPLRALVMEALVTSSRRCRA